MDVEYSIDSQNTDQEKLILVRSGYQAEETEIRILLPDAEAKRIVYLLPVEPFGQSRFGSGYDVVRQLNLHNQYAAVVVSPTFSDWPWYGNHPSNECIQQEAYFIDHVVAYVDTLYPRLSSRRLLLGFSKSGVGAMSLLLRHPDLFWAASVWDTTFVQERPDQWEMPDIFASQQNYDDFKVKTLLAKNASLLRDRKRIALTGYGIFKEFVEQSHSYLDELSIPHDYACDVFHEHTWNSGWLPDAMALLAKMSD